MSKVESFPHRLRHHSGQYVQQCRYSLCYSLKFAPLADSPQDDSAPATPNQNNLLYSRPSTRVHRAGYSSSSSSSSPLYDDDDDDDDAVTMFSIAPPPLFKAMRKGTQMGKMIVK